MSPNNIYEHFALFFIFTFTFISIDDNNLNFELNVKIKNLITSLMIYKQIEIIMKYIFKKRKREKSIIMQFIPTYFLNKWNES